LIIETKQKLTNNLNITTMKKAILTAAIALSVVFGISSSYAAATTPKTGISTVLTEVGNISEIEVHGNVQLYITSGSDEKVKVYNNYYAENALVQQQNGVLRISSYTADKLVVWVTVNDLAKLSVFDNAEVKSFGKFSALDLAVDLHNNALANLDLDAVKASFLLTDRAKADLSGSVEKSDMKYGRATSLNVTNFTAANSTKIVLSKPYDCTEDGEMAAL
jgi:hypothetical protein